MSKAIIYRENNGTPAVMAPTQEALDALGIMAIALKDVPKGKRFKILDAAEFAELEGIPQEAWVVDEADLTDGVGADFGCGSEWAVIDYDGDGKPDLLRNQRTGEYKRLTEE
jgi:hypothetical protein